jgi:hypothetical protein
MGKITLCMPDGVIDGHASQAISNIPDGESRRRRQVIGPKLRTGALLKLKTSRQQCRRTATENFIGVCNRPVWRIARWRDVNAVNY